MTKKTQILNIRLPNELILELDHFVKKKIFKSRSEAIREFARRYVQEQTTIIQTQTKIAKNSEHGGGRW